MNEYRIGNLVLRPGRELSEDGRRVPIGRKAIEILTFLAEADGAVVSKAEILDAIWPGIAVEENVIQVHVAAIRKALDQASDRLATVHGIGYQLWVDPPNSVPPDPRIELPVKPNVAVLKFETCGPNAEEAWFAEGVAEEILLCLSRISDIRTLARGSSFQIAAECRDFEEIHARLGATHVLCGSVRRQGQRLRIIAQLIIVPDGTVLWSDAFEGTDADVFAFQEAVAHAAAAALEQNLDHRANAFPIEPRVYDLYLKGRQISGIFEELPRCIALFRETTERAPEFAPGWASLALALAQRARWELPVAEFERAASEVRAVAMRALALDPGSANANIALGILEPLSAYSLRKGHLVRARAQGHADPETARQLGDFAYCVGQLQTALHWFEESLRSDPLNALSMEFYSTMLFHIGRKQECFEAYRYAREKWPEAWWFLSTPLLLAAFDRDWTSVDQLLAHPASGATEHQLARFVAKSLRQPSPQLAKETIAAAQAQLAHQKFVDPSTLLFLDRIGHREEAFALVEEADYGYMSAPEGRAIDKIGFHQGILFGPFAADFRADPRFVGLTAKLGLARFWTETHDWPDFASEVDYDLKALAAKSVAQPQQKRRPLSNQDCGRLKSVK